MKNRYKIDKITYIRHRASGTHGVWIGSGYKFRIKKSVRFLTEVEKTDEVSLLLRGPRKSTFWKMTPLPHGIQVFLRKC